MRAKLVGALLLVLAGCAVTPAPHCGVFDTGRLRADLLAQYRTDREWYETLIERMAWQLDCERNNHTGGENEHD